MTTEEPRPIPKGSFVRGQGLEFDRVLFFTDAVFAIAMTLLVFGITAPVLKGDISSPRILIEGLHHKTPEIVSFFVAFLVIGRYWLASHEFFSTLRSFDRSLVSLNLVYLAFIAFLPFPTLLVGRYERNPVSVVLFAICLATVSGLEVAMFHRAWKDGHTKKAIPRTIYRFGIVASMAPVVVFMLSVPLAFLNPTAALLLWLLVIPVEMVIARRAPAGLHDSLRARGG